MATTPCKPCAAKARLNLTPSTSSGTATTGAVPGAMYEVLSARGSSTGRKFTSKAAADGFAARIGGTVRVVG